MYASNCNSCNDFYAANNSCYYPTYDVCCCNSTSCYRLICQQSCNNFPISYKKLSQMPTRLKATNNETLAPKTAVKVRKKMAEKKAMIPIECPSKDTSLSNDSSIIETAIADSCYTTELRLCRSEDALGIRSNKSERITCGRLECIDSNCGYCCARKRLMNCRGEEYLDFKLLTHYAVPIKQVCSGGVSKYFITKSTEMSQISVRKCQQEDEFCRNLLLDKQRHCPAQPLKCCCTCCRTDTSTKVIGGKHEKSTLTVPQERNICTEEEIKKTQQSPEEACKTFLSVVCADILKSVQKSVDSKFNQLNCQITENFEVLSRKLDCLETSMQSRNCEMFKKMSAQNGKHFEKLCLIFGDLMEMLKQKPTARQDYQNKAIQCEEVLQKAADNESNGNDMKILRCGCCPCCSGHAADHLDEINYNQNAGNSEVTKIETHNAYLGVRKSGGCLRLEDNEPLLTEQLKTLRHPMQHSYGRHDPTDESKFKYKISKESFGTRQRATSPRTFTTFSLTPSGRTIFNCNCSTVALDVTSAQYSAANRKIETTLERRQEVKNFDTIRCAGRPHVTKEAEAAGSSGGGEKLLKKSSKHKYKAQSSDSITSKAMGW